jgi:putative transcriptional regulator
MNKPYAQLTKGTLLIASPEIDGGVYFRSAVLLCEHGPTGSLGLLLNKPLSFEIPEDVINLKEISNPHVQLFAGGPVQSNQMMLLHSFDQLPDQTLQICPGVFLGGDLPFLQQAIMEENGPHLRISFGYCGWAPGLLEKEFLSGLWFLHPASTRYIFETPVKDLWRILLRDMGGKYATLSTIPEDLSLN